MIDGNLANALFMQPSFLAVSSTQNVFVSDYVNHNIRIIRTDGIKIILVTFCYDCWYFAFWFICFFFSGYVATFAGSATSEPGYADGAGTSALFSNVTGIVFDVNGNLIVSDTNNHCIRLISSIGTNERTNL